MKLEKYFIIISWNFNNGKSIPQTNSKKGFSCEKIGRCGSVYQRVICITKETHQICCVSGLLIYHHDEQSIPFLQYSQMLTGVPNSASSFDLFDFAHAMHSSSVSKSVSIMLSYSLM